MEKVIINFNSSDVEKEDYSKIILDSIKNYFIWDRNIEYIFPQIKKWGPKLKNKIADWLKKMNIKKDFNVWFVSTKTSEAVFKIIFID